jgi:acyl-CoA reductase-like NAD-dependent aldehyde dehydrogenase
MPTSVALEDRPLFIAGRLRPALSGREFDDVSPVTGEVVGRMASSGADDVLLAIEAAAGAQTAWAGLPYLERRAYLLRAADLLEADAEKVRDLMALETGAVSGWAGMNVRESAATLREAAALTSAPIGELFPSHDPRTLNISIRRPAGVVLAIIPWNAPVILSARAVAIALAAGNTVVLRPSEFAPLAAGHVLADVLHRAGVPAGVINVVTTAPGDGRVLIERMIEHPSVRRVVFIGSTRVGRSIASVAGAALTPAVMELGGKNATIVRADADLDRWVPRLAFAAFANAGQVCMCSERILVHRDRSAELTERLAAFADGMSLGDPRDPSIEIGPVINAAAATTHRMMIDDAVAHGARVVAGGTGDGLFLRPTVLTGVTSASRFYSEESFTPIVSVASFADDDDAIRLANDGDYGLVSSVVSADGAAAEALAGRIAAGAVHVNGASVGDEPHVPFGGVGASGIGRLGGDESLRFFTEQRTIYRHP